jgi:RNA 2',3'-cyclic 3'-phosphodiesterase
MAAHEPGQELGDGKPDQFRLFIAVQIPDAIKTDIEKTQAELRRALPEGGVRWTRREQFHLTLRFLGNVEAQRVEALANELRQVCRSFAPLKLRAERIGFFPDLRRPRVVWVGVRDQQDRLPALQAAVQTATQAFTVEEPEGKFTGHVTLGRIKNIRRQEAEALAKAASGMAERFFGEWTAVQLEVMRSELSPTGARHTCLLAVPLGGQSDH